ncbi:hypothetical protein [Streptomyces sp. HUAS ZL42]|uniref:hypothetical protein n=1 Tax=Streptomyces sp. HUAS ZL42 TaxID=3231715 RepID=UPI00345E7DBA
MTTIDWRELTHAYGSAEDIPGLFARLGGTDDDAVWQDLWSALCHQGSVYDASWAALPVLADIALGRAPGGPADAVMLAGAITVDADDPRRDRYTREIEALLGVARELLAAPDQDAPSFVASLQSVLAFEGAGVWADALDGVRNEEYQLACPSCEDDLYVAFGEYGFFTSAGDYVGPGSKDTSGRTDLMPASPESLDGIGARLYREAATAGRAETARAVTYVFGRARCPSCGALIVVSEEVERQWI